MRDPKNEKLRNFRHGDRKWRRRYDDGVAPRDLRKIEPERIKIFPARRRLTVEERKEKRARRESMFAAKIREWSRSFSSSCGKKPLTQQQAVESLRAHSRMY